MGESLSGKLRRMDWSRPTPFRLETWDVSETWEQLFSDMDINLGF